MKEIYQDSVGDRSELLPDLPRNAWRGPVRERQMVRYPPKAETKAEREAREKRGEPEPRGLEFIVGRIES